MTVPLRRYTPSRYAGSTPLTVTSASSTSCSTGAKLPAKALFVEWAWTHAGVFCSGLSVSVAVSTAGAVLTARSTRRRGSRATATPTLHQGTPSVDIFRLCSSGRAFLCCNCRNGCQCSPDTRYQPQWRFPPGMDPQSSMLVDPPAQKGRRDSVQRWVRQLHSRYASFNAQWAPYRPCAALRHR